MSFPSFLLDFSNLPCKGCDEGGGGLDLRLMLTSLLLHTAGDVEARLPVSGDQGGEQAVRHPGHSQQRVHREREDLINDDLLLAGMISDHFSFIIDIKPERNVA